jgi:hypothetical protein
VMEQQATNKGKVTLCTQTNHDHDRRIPKSNRSGVVLSDIRLRICKQPRRRLTNRSRPKIGAYNKQGYWKYKSKKPRKKKLIE